MNPSPFTPQLIGQPETALPVVPPSRQIKVGILGAGSFAGVFIPLFQAHPLVHEVVIAEHLPERRAKEAERFKIRETYGSLEELCASDVDAVAIFTQRWMHAPQAIYAMNHGKHVYSAVPAAVTVEEMQELMDTVKRTGLTYMLGETSYYYPSAIFCRQKYRSGEMGAFVYGEGEYLHDMSHWFYDAFHYSGGPEWKKTAGFPPLLYPTHSVGMILSVTGAHMTSVSALGYKDRHPDQIFTPTGNLWKNCHSNQTALFRTSDGGMARINEFRRIGHSALRSVRVSMFGTEGCFEEEVGHEVWTTRNHDKINLADLLRCSPITSAQIEAQAQSGKGTQEDFYSGMAPIHPKKRLPSTFEGHISGHFGSHQFLVDDFLRSAATRLLPPNHVWNAAKYNVPGIIAHASALKEGEQMPVPHLGEPPLEGHLDTSLLWSEFVATYLH